MGRIRVLSDQVANQIAAGEVVERPASVVKELLENSLDAGASRIRVDVEAGGRKLIRIADNGHGMGRDDALLAFERHATSKLRSSDDLLSIATLGFRGEALPSIASVARLTLETRAVEDELGTSLEIAGGKLLRVEDAGLPPGTTLAVRDLFFNTPARRKFLRSEQTELGHVAALVTHYALAHPQKHFELHSATQQLVSAPAVANAGERIFQLFGRDVFESMLPVVAEMDFARAGLPEPPPWKRDADYEPPTPGFLRISGYTSKPELQKLNRNSIYVFVNGRLIRDRLVLHAMSEAYRNIIAPTAFPVTLLFLEMPAEEVDVNVHPAKTEVRFRQSAFVHDFVRDSVRTAMMKARPAASFAFAMGAGALGGTNSLASSLLVDVSPLPGLDQTLHDPNALPVPQSEGVIDPGDTDSFSLTSRALMPETQRLGFTGAGMAIGYDEALSDKSPVAPRLDSEMWTGSAQTSVTPGLEDSITGTHSHAVDEPSLDALNSLRPLGQVANSFIVAVNAEGLWLIDQHVAHERILYERVMRERTTERVQRQRLLMPLLIDLLPEQMVMFAEIAEELARNGFEAEPFGPRTLAIKSAPVGLEGRELEQLLAELLTATERTGQNENEEARRSRIAASIACHAAVKINMPLDGEKMRWLLEELAKCELPMGCPHGRPIALRYSLKDIQRAFQRI
jgi:DNA mismatch repair protein MutL